MPLSDEQRALAEIRRAAVARPGNPRGHIAFAVIAALRKRGLVIFDNQGRLRPAKERTE